MVFIDYAWLRYYVTIPLLLHRFLQSFNLYRWDFFSREGKRTTFTYPEIYIEDVSQPWLLSGQIWYHKVNCLNIFCNFVLFKDQLKWPQPWFCSEALAPCHFSLRSWSFFRYFQISRLGPRPPTHFWTIFFSKLSQDDPSDHSQCKKVGLKAQKV